MRKLMIVCLLFLLTIPILAQDEQTPYEIALQRIERAADSGARQLDLSGLRLTSLPPEISNLTNLQWLLLSDNQLRAVPPEIGDLINLRYLSLANNQLSVLPPEIGDLINLRYLSLANNQLSVLPPEIGDLINLQHLDVSSNPLVSPPPKIVEQGHLAILDYLQAEVVRREDEKQRLMLMAIGGVGLFAALMLGFRLKQRGQRKPKQKREMVA